MAKKGIINTSIEEIKNNWSKMCVESRQTLKNKDSKDLQYINTLISKGLNNNTINTRLERYRKIRITEESLNKKRSEFEARLKKESKRIDLSKWKNRLFLHYFIDELEDNLYYNQKVVWCNRCERTHRINSNIAWDHNIKPIPIKCKVDEDHCWNWKDINQKKIFGMDIYNYNDYRGDGLFITHREGSVEECIVCGKKGLRELTFMTDNIDLTATQLKEVNEYIQSIKNMEFEKLEKLSHKTFSNGSGGIIIQIPELDKKIREIQNIEDYIIISLF